MLSVFHLIARPGTSPPGSRQYPTESPAESEKRTNWMDWCFGTVTGAEAFDK
uniref:Uncharacterized protein n=1 Tax=Anguilla anguilla TaxID=7936 RepID=A0A0E9SA09_ANGAN